MTALEKLAEEHVYERYEYVKLLNKIKLDDAYLAKILELRLFSDEHIANFLSAPLGIFDCISCTALLSVVYCYYK